MDDLKPCPFCGGEAEMDTRRGFIPFDKPRGIIGNACVVYCLECGVEVGEIYDFDPEYYELEFEHLIQEVKAKWNRRAPDPVREALRNLADAMDEYELFGTEHEDAALDDARAKARNALDASTPAAPPQKVVEMYREAREAAENLHDRDAFNHWQAQRVCILATLRAFGCDTAILGDEAAAKLEDK